eukprot:2316946-Prymnesium_polylepis.1
MSFVRRAGCLSDHVHCSHARPRLLSKHTPRCARQVHAAAHAFDSCRTRQAWGRLFDGMKLDAGDAIGALLCLAGVVVIL